MEAAAHPTGLRVDGTVIEVSEGDRQRTLLEVLRRNGVTTVKDGCSPQGQCGCCTVLIDGAARVACVTPVRRVLGADIRTVAGLDDDAARRFAGALCATGGTQCGFCTPGIVVRLAALEAKTPARLADSAAVTEALLAHLCRCTGWQTITEAAALVASGARVAEPSAAELDEAAGVATREGGAAQVVGSGVALGQGGFADDLAPLDALVALPDGAGGWVVGEGISEARALRGKVQGRRTTAPLRWPIDVAPGAWDLVLHTTWTEPAALEPDAAWCAPGADPVGPSGNGGAFGAKASSPVAAAAQVLAERHGRAVRVLLDREDVVTLTAKRPPLALGLRADGSGIVRAAATPGLAEAVAAWFPSVAVEEVTVSGPPTSLALRGAVWAEVAAAIAVATAVDEIEHPNGGRAEASLAGVVLTIRVSAGRLPAGAVGRAVLRSYVIGAAHQALGWVRSEAITVDEAGGVHDLTMRSFGILRARDTPHVEVVLDAFDDRAPMPVSAAVLAAVAVAAWRAEADDAGALPTRWPTRRA